MRQIWRPLGRVVAPEIRGDWWQSHASYPTPLLHADGRITVFFSVRNQQNRSCLASLDVVIEAERVSPAGPVRGPLLEPGERGAFDADGVTVTSFLRQRGQLLAYYLGWTVGVGVPFANFIGIAVGDAEGHRFERMGRAPIIGRSEANPLTLGYPWALPHGDGYRMWFGSHLRWGPSGLEMEHVVKQANSADGFNWTPDPAPVVPLAGAIDPAEFAVSRPSVLREADGTLSMWYARRNPDYSLGFACSADDGAGWKRMDDVVTFTGEPASWEARERTYPAVFDHHGRRYMLYNGDGYGRTGFGLARLEV